MSLSRGGRKRGIVRMGRGEAAYPTNKKGKRANKKGARPGADIKKRGPKRGIHGVAMPI